MLLAGRFAAATLWACGRRAQVCVQQLHHIVVTSPPAARRHIVLGEAPPAARRHSAGTLCLERINHQAQLEPKTCKECPGELEDVLHPFCSVLPIGSYLVLLQLYFIPFSLFSLVLSLFSLSSLLSYSYYPFFFPSGVWGGPPQRTCACMPIA